MSGRERANDERGMSVLELVVASSLLLLFSVMAFNFLTSANSTANRTTKNVQAENDVRLALRGMTEDIRAADPITMTYPSGTTCPSGGSFPSGYSTCVSFTVVRNTLAGQNCPKSVITYGLVNGTVKRDDVEYNSSCAVSSSYAGKTVVSNVVNPSGTNLFRFFDSGGREITMAALPTPTSSSFVSAASVMVTLVVQYQSGAPPITVSSTAALRNNRA